MRNVPKVGTGAGRQEAAPDRRSQDPAGKAGHETELLVRAQLGDGEAYEELVRLHQRRVFAVVGGILRRREDVEDVAQQVFIKAYFSLKRFDQRAAFGTWLYKIAVNECWDYLRKKRVRPLVYEADLSKDQARRFGASQEEPGARADFRRRLELRQNVERLLAELDERDRLMLILKEVEGFAVEEIGEIVGLNVNTVKVRLFRARGRLVALHQKRLREAARVQRNRRENS